MTENDRREVPHDNGKCDNCEGDLMAPYYGKSSVHTVPEDERPTDWPPDEHFDVCRRCWNNGLKNNG